MIFKKFFPSQSVKLKLIPKHLLFDTRQTAAAEIIPSFHRWKVEGKQKVLAIFLAVKVLKTASKRKAVKELTLVNIILERSPVWAIKKTDDFIFLSALRFCPRPRLAEHFGRKKRGAIVCPCV